MPPATIEDYSSDSESDEDFCEPEPEANEDQRESEDDAISTASNFDDGDDLDDSDYVPEEDEEEEEDFENEFPPIFDDIIEEEGVFEGQHENTARLRRCLEGDTKGLDTRIVEVLRYMADKA